MSTEIENLPKEIRKKTISYLIGLIFVLLLAEIGLTWRFTILLYYYLSFGVIALLIPLIIAPVFIGSYLSKHSNPLYKKAGKILDKLFMYTAMMQGIFYVTLVFLVIGGLTVEAPDFSSTQKFMYEWIAGSLYTTYILYGIGGFLLFFSKHNFVGYLLCVLTLLYGWGSLIVILEFEKELQEWYYAHTTFGNILYFVSQLLFSFLYMHIMVLSGKNIKQEEDSPTTL